MLPHERMHAAFEDGQIVGGAGAFPFELSVPGGSLPCAGVTAVGVHPTHRRRGVLRSMMDAQLRDVHERGEPIAALWASRGDDLRPLRLRPRLLGWRAEGAARVGRVRASRSSAAGTARFVTPEEARELFPPVWEARAARAAGHAVEERGVVGGPPAAPARAREPKRRSRFVALELDGEPQALRDLPDALRVRGRSAGVEARRARGARRRRRRRRRRSGGSCSTSTGWRVAEVPLAPPDHPLFLLLAHAAPGALPDGRRLVGAARRRRRRAVRPRVRRRRAARLRGARRGVPVERRALEARAAASCERTEEEPDLALDVSALGSAYLGAVSFTQLREALRVRGAARRSGRAGGRALRAGARCRGASRSSDSSVREYERLP